MLLEAFPELFCLENWLLGGNWKGYDYSWKEKGEKGDGGDWKKDWSKSGDDWKQARTSLSLEKKLRTGRRRMIGRLAVSVESVASVRSKTTTSGVVERRSTLGTPKLKWRSSSLLDSIGLDAWSSPPLWNLRAPPKDWKDKGKDGSDWKDWKKAPRGWGALSRAGGRLLWRGGRREVGLLLVGAQQASELDLR